MPHFNLRSIALSCVLCVASIQIVTAQPNSLRIKQEVELLSADSLLGRGFGSSSGKIAAEYISRQFETNAFKPAYSSFISPFLYRMQGIEITGQNVAAIIEGSHPELKNEYLVIGAHYDHIGYETVDGQKVVYNGADDNASGVAAMLELGRMIVAMDPKPKRSIILVAFDGEESGLIGSDYFVKNSPVPMTQIKAMFSLDMVGMLKANNGIDLTGIRNLMPLGNSLEQIAQKNQITITQQNAKTEGRTDTKPFAKQGVPSVHATTGTLSPYHKPEDDADLLDYEGLTQITSFLTDLVTFLANSEQLQSTPKFAKNFDRPSFRTLRFGIAGAMGTNKNDYYNDFYKSKSGLAVKMGLLTQVKVSNFVSLQTGLDIEVLNNPTETGKLTQQNITVPFNIMLTSNSSGPDIPARFFAFGGAYYSHKFGGSLNQSALDFETQFNPQDIGVQFGFGFDLPHAQVMFTKHYGGTDIYKDNTNPAMTNEGFYISLAYIF